MYPDSDNPWKETVCDLYDELHFGEDNFFNSPLARRLVALLEDRHPEWFRDEVPLDQMDQTAP